MSVNKVTYKKIERTFSMNGNEGLSVFRVYYSPNIIGVVTEKKQKVLFIPAYTDDEFKSANDVADSFIIHMKETTGHLCKKIRDYD